MFLATGAILKFFEQYNFQLYNLQGIFIRVDKKVCGNRTPVLSIFQKIGIIYQNGQSQNIKEDGRNLMQNKLNIFTLAML